MLLRHCWCFAISSYATLIHFSNNHIKDISVALMRVLTHHSYCRVPEEHIIGRSNDARQTAFRRNAWCLFHFNITQNVPPERWTMHISQFYTRVVPPGQKKVL